MTPTTVDQLSYVKLTAQRDSLDVFLGEPLFREGEVVYGVMDPKTEMIYANLKSGCQFIRYYGFFVETVSHVNAKGMGDVLKFVKELEVREWIKANNVFDNYLPIQVMFDEDVQHKNNAGPHAGTEYFKGGRKYFGIVLKGPGNDALIQIRKGAIFYLPYVKPAANVEILDDMRLSYDQLKEIRFLIENDHRTVQQLTMDI